MVMVFFHENLGFSQFSTCHPVSDLIRRTDVVGICRDLLAIDRRIRLLCDSPGLPLALDYPRGIVGAETGPETKGSTSPAQGDISG